MLKRLKVLLITSRRYLKARGGIIGEAPLFALGDKEAEDYIELLSACNMPFDIKYGDELGFEDLVSDGKIKYSTILLSLPEDQLSNQTINDLRKASYAYGISIVASYDRVKNRMKQIFGIDKIRGKRFCIPCKIVINNRSIKDSKVEPEIKLGDGLKIRMQKFGLRKHPINYFKRHFKKLYSQVLFYMRIETLPDAEVLGVIKTKPDVAIIKYRFGEAINYYIALQSDFFLDRFNSLHRIVREIIGQNSGWGMVYFNLEDTMILRMDDPGTCERVYLKGYDEPLMKLRDWLEIIAVMKRQNASLSVMYVPLWVDDGSPENGKIYWRGKELIERKGGAIFCSKDIRYFKKNNEGKKHEFDYTEEFRALKTAVESGMVDIESHGLTHVDTNLEQWLKADDRYSNYEWYHEFKHVKANRDVSETEQAKIFEESAKLIKEHFGILPCAVTPSGHQQSKDSETIAQLMGYKLFSSDYNSIMKDGIVIRNDKIRSIFFEATKPEACFRAAGYPVVGVFHDYDIVRRSPKWLEERIAEWKNAGICNFITLKALIGYLCSSIEAYNDNGKLHFSVDISNTGDVSNNRESRYFFKNGMKLTITLPEARTPGHMHISVDGRCIKDFSRGMLKNEIQLSLPPFLDKDKLGVEISLSM